MDELYWEHHVNFLPLSDLWNTGGLTKYMNDSIPAFARLRQAGIRAHSWT